MRTRIAVATILAGVAGGANAATDWTFDPNILVRYETDDNNRLTNNPGQEIDVSGALIDIQATVRAKTPRSDFRMVPRYRTSVYPNDEDEERNAATLTADWVYRGERSRSELDMLLSQRTILGRYYPDSSVPDDGGLGEPGQGTGAGRSEEKTDQTEFNIRPRFSFQLTERMFMLLRLGYQDVSFDEQVENDREDFTDADAAVGIGFRTSPAAMFAVYGGVSRYEPESGINSDSQLLNAEWSNQLSELSRVYVRGGASRTKTDAVGADWETGFNGGAGVQWDFEVTELFLEFNHYQDPSASGRMVNREQLRAQWLRRFSERTSLMLSGRAIRDEKIGEDDTFETREYVSAAAEFEWRFTQQVSAAAGYEYTWRKYENDVTDAVSNLFYLGVRYRPKRR